MAKFLTLNTHSWMEDQPEEKLAALVQRILEEDYDVICLQEVNQLQGSSESKEVFSYQPVPGMPRIHQDHYARTLVEQLEQKGRTYHWSWVYNHIGFDRFHEGVAILAKNPLQVEALTLSDMDDPADYRTRKVLLAQTELDGQLVSLASCHFSWWEKGFQGEWARLEARLSKLGTPLLLMGDFNCPFEGPGYREILASSLGLKDSHIEAKESLGQATVEGEIAGWEGNQEAYKIDYAFLSSEWTVEQSSVVFDNLRGPIISDHYGLEVLAHL
ncbi:endonuclease/exonuclease/phosphatase family protein [Streptococcus oricebi]|uniref:Hydrolase n=1 Tax=Streptococcus oricebi TaxID=1547447 RepID=A0ABS5B2U5_9STRE|nr:endonuclease/exonuclease/phosphatase family protein [Streptococcus oricebi]MBP2622826.1 hydrolase [Streptococcus oricebi]